MNSLDRLKYRLQGMQKELSQGKKNLVINWSGRVVTEETMSSAKYWVYSIFSLFIYSAVHYFTHKITRIDEKLTKEIKDTLQNTHVDCRKKIELQSDLSYLGEIVSKIPESKSPESKSYNYWKINSVSKNSKLRQIIGEILLDIYLKKRGLTREVHLSRGIDEMKRENNQTISIVKKIELGEINPESISYVVDYNFYSDNCGTLYTHLIYQEEGEVPCRSSFSHEMTSVTEDELKEAINLRKEALEEDLYNEEKIRKNLNESVEKIKATHKKIADVTMSILYGNIAPKEKLSWSNTCIFRTKKGSYERLENEVKKALEDRLKAVPQVKTAFHPDDSAYQFPPHVAPSPYNPDLQESK